MEAAFNISTVKGFSVGVLAMLLYNIFGSSVGVLPDAQSGTQSFRQLEQQPPQLDEQIACPPCAPPAECLECTCPACTSTFDFNAQIEMTDMIRRNYDVDDYHNPRILELAQLFTAEECDRIIRDVTANPLEAAVVVNPSFENDRLQSKEQVQKIQSRRSRTAGLDRNHGNFSDVYNRILQTVAQQNDKFWRERIPRNFNSDMMENIQFGMYEATDKGHYNWHSDTGVKGALAKRKLSAVLMLSDPDSYTGGVFQIQATAKSTDFHLKRGTLVIFPSYVLHRVTEVLTGVRYSLAVWIQTE